MDSKEYSIKKSVSLYIEICEGKLKAIQTFLPPYGGMLTFHRFQIQFYMNPERKNDDITESVKACFKNAVKILIVENYDMLKEIYTQLKENDECMFQYLEDAIKEVTEELCNLA